jgi:hypothetical protein
MKTILLIIAIALATVAAVAPAAFVEAVVYVASLLATLTAFIVLAISGAWTLDRLDMIQNLSRGHGTA